MRYSESLVDLIGNTPLVRLRSVAAHLGPDAPLVLAKVEYFNPGGSVKDRIAVRMIDAAEASGELRPGGTIVEPTSGNTGIGLAIVAQQRGYACVFVCPDKVSGDKIDTLRAFGAEVVVCPTAVAPEDPRSYYSVSDRLARERPGGWKPNQYANTNNPRSHYETTGPELWAQTEGRITHFVAGVGTGGTVSGTGRYLKEQGAVRVIGADPEGSVYSGGTGRPYLVEGVGEDFWPDTYDRTICDEIVAVSDAASFAMTRRLAREEGMLVGGSCGMAVVAALDVAARCGPDDVVVVLLPDGGRGYLSKIFNDGWMADYGFVAAAGESSVGDVLRSKSGDTPSLVHGHPNETVREAIDILREYGVSQMPVVRAEPPVTAGEVVGSVSERALLEALFTGSASLADALEPHMSPALPIIGSGEPVSAAVEALGDADALLVHVDGKPTGRADAAGPAGAPGRVLTRGHRCRGTDQLSSSDFSSSDFSSSDLSSSDLSSSDLSSRVVVSTRRRRRRLTRRRRTRRRRRRRPRRLQGGRRPCRARRGSRCRPASPCRRAGPRRRRSRPCRGRPCSRRGSRCRRRPCGRCRPRREPARRIRRRRISRCPTSRRRRISRSSDFSSSPDPSSPDPSSPDPSSPDFSLSGFSSSSGSSSSGSSSSGLSSSGLSSSGLSSACASRPCGVGRSWSRPCGVGRSSAAAAVVSSFVGHGVSSCRRRPSSGVRPNLETRARTSTGTARASGR